MLRRELTTDALRAPCVFLCSGRERPAATRACASRASGACSVVCSARRTACALLPDTHGLRYAERASTARKATRRHAAVRRTTKSQNSGCALQSMASPDEDDWLALAAALAGADAAVQERLLRRAVFSEPWLVQWQYPALLLARARALLAAAAARPPPEFPGVRYAGSVHRWQLGHAGARLSGCAPSAREAALARDDEMRRLGVEKKHLTFSYDGGLPVLNQARVPCGSAGVNFKLHAAAGLSSARSLDCQNPNGCPRRAAQWYKAQLALCEVWCAAAQGAHNRPTLTRRPAPQLRVCDGQKTPWHAPLGRGAGGGPGCPGGKPLSPLLRCARRRVSRRSGGGAGGRRERPDVRRAGRGKAPPRAQRRLRARRRARRLPPGAARRGAQPYPV